MAKRSAGLLLYRHRPGGIEVFLPCIRRAVFGPRRIEARGPFPKANYESDEPALEAARREFHEERDLRKPALPPSQVP